MLFLDSLAYDGPSFTDWSFAMTAITEIYIYTEGFLFIHLYWGSPGKHRNIVGKGVLYLMLYGDTLHTSSSNR